MNDLEVTLPKLGESITSATIVQWFKKEGDPIGKDEPLLEVATDKVNSEIPSPVGGIVKKIHAEVDQELDVGELLAVIASEEGGDTSLPPLQKQEAEKGGSEMEGYYSPAVFRLAKEKGISLEELAGIKGSGASGRVTKKDLEGYKKGAPCPMEREKSAELEGVEYIKMSGMRKAIAESMVRSAFEVPHASLVCEVDVTDVMELLAREKGAFLQKHGFKLTITTFVARAIARALQEYPLLNASVEGDTILVKRFVNLGIAVSVEQGIMVPVIRNIQKLSLTSIAKEVADFATRSKGNQLKPDDVKEGTVTMTNFGMSGVQIGIPIIRHPEVAIVGIGAVTKRVVAIDNGLFGVRKILHISLTFDHRVVDGMYGCDFLASLKTHLESDLDIDL